MWKLIWLVTHCMQRPGSQRMACSKNYEWSFFITACRVRIGMAQQRLRDGLRLWVLSHSGFCLLSYSHSISCSRTSVYHWPFLQSGPSGFWYLFTCWLSFLLENPSKSSIHGTWWWDSSGLQSTGLLSTSSITPSAISRFFTCQSSLRTPGTQYILNENVDWVTHRRHIQNLVLCWLDFLLKF